MRSIPGIESCTVGGSRAAKEIRSFETQTHKSQDAIRGSYFFTWGKQFVFNGVEYWCSTVDN